MAANAAITGRYNSESLPPGHFERYEDITPIIQNGLKRVACFQNSTVALSDVGHCYSADASTDNYFAVLIFAAQGSCDVPNTLGQTSTEWLL